MWHRMIRKPRMYWKGRDRGLIWHPVPTFTGRACGEPRKTSRITELRPRILIRGLPNMKEDWQPLDPEFRPLCLLRELWYLNILSAFFPGHFYCYLIQDVIVFLFIWKKRIWLRQFLLLCGTWELRRWSFTLLWNKCNSPTVLLHWILDCYIKY